jgi:hypothetical protein
MTEEETDKEKFDLLDESFSFTVTICRDDIKGLIGEEKALKFTDEMMEELVRRLKDDYMSQLYNDSMEVIVKEKLLPQIE